MPFLSRLAAAFSPPGSFASSKRSRSSASFSAVVCGRPGTDSTTGSVAVTACLPHLKARVCLALVQSFAHVFAHLGDDRLVDGLDVLAPDVHDLEVRDGLA